MTDSFNTSDIAEKAKGAFAGVKDKTTEFAQTANETAKAGASHVANEARNFASDAAGKVESAVSDRKSMSADYLGSIAAATERAAGEFENDLPQAATFIREASKQLQGVADTVRTRDVRELVTDIQDLARRQPTLFFGGALILGFAAFRFLKSAPPRTANGSAAEG